MCPTLSLSDFPGGFKPLPRITAAYPGPPGEGLPRFGGRSLEEDVGAGDGGERDRAGRLGIPYQVPLTINGAPASVVHSLRWLMGKEGLHTLAAVSRYVSRAGTQVLERIEALSQLRAAWREGYERGDEAVLGAFVNQRYAMFGALSATPAYLKASFFHWVSGAITEMALETGLPHSTMALAALVAGLAQSTEWVLPRYTALFVKGVLDFCRYLEIRARAVVPG